jgi:hypothetical protein
MELFAGFLIVFYVLMFGGMAATYGFAIWALVDAARRPDWAFRMARADKTMWIVLLGVLLAVCWPADAVMAAVYFFSIRPKLQEAEAWYAQQAPWPAPPPTYPYGSPPTYQ